LHSNSPSPFLNNTMIKELTKKAAPKSKELNLDTAELKKAALILRAINHQLRQKILLLIHKQGKVNVSRIYAKLRIEQSVASQHLAVLRKAGFVTTEREGQNIFYSVNYPRVSQVQEFARKLVG
jgi:DNA-binding transcriptional ArsR family regulator